MLSLISRGGVSRSLTKGLICLTSYTSRRQFVTGKIALSFLLTSLSGRFISRTLPASNSERRLQMTRLGKATRMRLMAIVLCLLAFSVYIAFAPSGSYAASCTCGGGMDNKCDGSDRCVCMSVNGACTRCEWSNNDANCTKPCDEFVIVEGGAN